MRPKPIPTLTLPLKRREFFANICRFNDPVIALADKEVNVLDMINKSRGELAFNLIDVEGVPTADVIGAIEQVHHVIWVRVIEGNA